MPARILSRLDNLERNQAWFARKLGMDLSHVYRWLSGERPIPQRRIAQIAQVLGVTVEWLTSGTKAADEIAPDSEDSKRVAAVTGETAADVPDEDVAA